jgi:hypothetical protein
MIISFFVHDPLLLGLAGTAICALVWGGVKAGL